MGWDTRYRVMEGLKAELKEIEGWFHGAFGKFSLNELSEHMTFDVIISPPGYSRRQTTFGFDEMYGIFEKISNRYEENYDATIWEIYDKEYRGTYERPWTLYKYRLLNDRGETVQHGRSLFVFRRVGGKYLISANVWKIVSPHEDFNMLDYMPEWFRL